MLLYLAPESVRKDKIKSEIAKTNKLGSKFLYTRSIFTRADGLDRVDESVFGYWGDG